MNSLPCQYDVYFFDFFDTIVSRRISPEYVKRIWSKEIKYIYNITCDENEIYLLRSKIEATLCEMHQKKEGELEFKYGECIKELYDRLNINGNYEVFYQDAYDLECEIEARVQFLCEDVINQIKELQKRKKKIICVSDFYMPKEFIEYLMEFHGIRGYFDDVYVSSDMIKTKRSGRLYEYICEKESLEPKEVLMIGDNEWSDYQSAQNFGLNAILIDRKQQKEMYLKFEKEHENSTYLNRSLERVYNGCNRDKYEDIAFSLYLFTEKLYIYARKNKIRHLFFLSREGEFLKKVFDTYQSSRIKSENGLIKTHYLIVSRKSTLIASLTDIEHEKFEIIFRQYINISLYDFLSSLGFEESVQKEIGNQLSCDLKEKKEDFPNSVIFAELKKNPIFLSHYEKLRIQQKRNLKQYIASFGADIEREGMHIVDVGWKGTIQDNLYYLYEEHVEMEGLYIGMVAPGTIAEKNKKSGLLFSCIQGISRYFSIYAENTSIFEVLLGASHGSADHYALNGDKIIPITKEQKEERELFINVVSPIQEGIYRKIDEINLLLINAIYSTDKLENIVAGYHAKLVYLPQRKQIDLFYNIYHYENFGVFEYSKFALKKRVSFSQRIKYIIKIIKMKDVHVISYYCGVIELKNAGLSFLIRPYGWYMYHKHYTRE